MCIRDREKVVLWEVAQTEPYQAFRDTQNGSILLYHARMVDYECLKTLIPMLPDAGFEFVTVSDLLGLEPLVLDKPDDCLLYTSGIQVYGPLNSDYAKAVADADTYREMGQKLLDAMKTLSLIHI